ncbi:MAG TPA: DNA polymerase III subunit alpha [Candidatus Paceibacterota bacterium]
MSKFIHLHTHSHYSLLNALPKIDVLVDTAKKDGMTALALTDNSNLYGAIEFYKTCKKKDIKPIIGIDAYVAYRSRKDKETRVDKERYRLVLLAKNEVGYKNLIKLVTFAHIEGFYYKPRIDKELLEKYGEGLIAIMPSFSGDIAKSLQMVREDQAMERLEWYKKNFPTSPSGVPDTGQPNFYLEVTHHPEIKGHEENMKRLVEFAQKTNTPLVAAQDVYYMTLEDRQARETLLAVQSQHDDKIEKGDDDFSFISAKTAEKYFKDLPDSLENTIKIANRCNLEISIDKWFLPNYIVESGLSHDEEFRRIVKEGLKEKGLTKTPEINERMEYELKVIKDKGYAPYFLVVSDLLHHAHKNGILTTIRGSVAGSLCTYLAGITNVDPLLYKLPFERFLNPERPSAPDIDMDFADDRRDEMIDYARAKYGVDKVAQIGTFGTMAARGSVRDVTRALGFPYSLGDSIAKLIPMGAQGFPMTINKALKDTPELKTLYQNEPDVKKIIDMAKKIEGCARHISVHAAGVVIAPTPLTDYVPLQYDTKGDNKVITQYDMNDVGEDGVGLLKFDFLGIRNLSILADAVKLTEKIEGVKIDIENVPVDDKKTFEMLARGETTGLFQLNGDGMTRFLKELRPTAIHDINAMVALYRPGPMESIPQYIERKHNQKLIKYLDPRMKEYLGMSYGLLVYQDDVMLTAINLAGYSWLEADKLRKAMGKKIPEVMAAEKEKLFSGLVKNGMSEEKAEEMWKLIEPFAAYGFNKAHAASYGKVAYQTAYMKANFPAIYMSAVLTAESGDIEKIAEIIGECKRMQIPVLPPDINESFEGFTVIKGVNSSTDSIRFGLTTIKNFGAGISASIIAERKVGGKFKSISDFLQRIKDKNLNKKSLESLIKAGAMDSFGKERAELLHNLDRLLTFNKEERSKESDQNSLFGRLSKTEEATEVELEKTPPTNPADKLMWEKELLGLYISGHPLDSFKHKLENKETNIKKLKETAKERDVVVFGAIVEEIRPIMTKNNEKMVFLKLSDLTDSIEAVAFPKILTEFQDIIVPESCLVVKGTFSTRNGEKSVLIDKVRLM